MKNLVLKNKITLNLGKLTLVLLIPITLFSSCNFRNNKRLIPDKDLVKILTEIYVADGLLTFPSIKNYFSSKDSVENYIDIIQRYGYTKERMDKTLRYYYDVKPKKLENIYDQVLGKLYEKQLKIEKNAPVSKAGPENLWTGPGSYSVPESGVQNLGWFANPVKDTGSYVLEFSAILYPDDQSVNPNVVVYFYHADSLGGYRDYWPVTNLIKDGQKHKFSLSKRNANLSVTHISGGFFNCDPKEGRWGKHAKIEDIVLRKDVAK